MKHIITLIIFFCLTATLLASNVGKRYPSEKFQFTDSVTGRTVTALTASEFSDAKPYHTHDTWTADGKWIIFRSNRGGNGSQIFVVNETTGDIVQLTDDNTVNSGSVNLSRKEMKLFYLRGGRARRADAAEEKPVQIVELNIGKLLSDAMNNRVKTAAAYERVVCTLPKDTRTGGLALDADESKLYIGVSFSMSDNERQTRPDHQTDSTAIDNRANIDNRNTDPNESREAARQRFELAGRGKSGIRAIDVATGKISEVIDIDFRLGHLQCNPYVAGEIIYCHETTGDAIQRIWSVRADGTGNRPIYIETPDEWITHETVSGKDEVMFLIMGHLPYLREKPTGIAVINLRNGQMKLLGQVEEDMGRGRQGGFWHSNGSPDGLWATGDTFKGSIYLINRLTGERKLLTTGHIMRPDHAHPIFSRNSKRILIQSGMLSGGRVLNLMTVEVE